MFPCGGAPGNFIVCVFLSPDGLTIPSACCGVVHLRRIVYHTDILSMSVRSFFLLAIASVGVLLGSVSTAQADACSYACQVSYSALANPATGAPANTCATNADCSNRCVSVCAALTGGPPAQADTASPSTCVGGSSATPGACSPCSCAPRPTTPVACTTSGDPACTSSCNGVCGAYSAPDVTGVSRIACRTSPAPSCSVAPVPTTPTPAAPTGADAGYCRYSCVFQNYQIVETQTACTIESGDPATRSLRADCPSNIAQPACEGVGMDVQSSPADPTQPSLACRSASGSGAGRCAVYCQRRTAVTPEQAGTCSPTGPVEAQLTTCNANCNSVCGARRMRCAGSAICTGSGTRGNCQFSCEMAVGALPQDDRAATCSVTNTEASSISCSQRCTTACAALGGGCSSQPAAVCIATNPTAPNTNGTQTTQPGNPSRTAPAFTVEFPDPFGGRLNLPQIIGNIIRIIVGLCGVLFLGVFVYGGLTYMMSAGNPKKVAQGQAAIVNAVIGLTVVLLSYVAVSLVIQVSNTVQGTSGTTPAGSTNTTLRPGGTTQATGRSSQGTSAGSDAATTGQAAIAGTPESACRLFYQADPATCAASRGGNCPNGVTNIDTLIRAWGSAPVAPIPGEPDPMIACRQCLQNDVQGRLTNLYPGITESCTPAIVNSWSTTCNAACNPNAITQSGSFGSTSDICAVEGYNVNDASCRTCIDYWSMPDNSATLDAVSCLTVRSRAAVWCATAESPSQLPRGQRSQSGGHCNPITR